MSNYIVDLRSDSVPKIEQVGGKATNLMRLAQMTSISVPPGFCLTTSAYDEVCHLNKDMSRLLDELNLVDNNNRDKIKEVCKKIRTLIIHASMSNDITEELSSFVKKFGAEKSYAVRSSATAEDLPDASFAGQHDSYLGVVGFDNIITNIKKCWASLFTDRAVSYRIQNEIDHDTVKLAVVVQEMIYPDYSGVLFTADPLTSVRSIVSIDACYGLGDAYVSGLTNADNYRVVNGTITTKKVMTKHSGVYLQDSGEMKEVPLHEQLTKRQILPDSMIIELEQIGRKIETDFSHPQDIEWCISDNRIHIVQSRPITTLYPLPEKLDNETRIYVSSGHLQMMTAPIKPLGIHFYKEVISNPPSIELGGRLYLDVSHDLSSVVGRMMAKSLFKVLGDQLLTDSVVTLANDKQLRKQLPKGKTRVFSMDNNNSVFKILINAYKAYKMADPNIISDIINHEEKDIQSMGQELNQLSGDRVFEYIYNDHDNRRMKLMPPKNAGVITAAMLSIRSFDKKIKKWLGEENAADTIIMSVPNSITTDTGFKLMDVTDAIRDFPNIIAYLRNPNDQTFYEDLQKLEGGDRFVVALKAYLYEYGMRCSGDIDITVERWIENPLKIVPVILRNLDNFEPHAAALKHKQGVAQSQQRLEEIVSRLRRLRGGNRKANKIIKLAHVIRQYVGYREYPKFSYMKRYYYYKLAMLKEAEILVQKGILNKKEDSYYLYFDELRNLVNGQEFDNRIIEARRESYKHYETLSPPRVLTSNGDVMDGEYDAKSLPKNALPGIAVSAGVIEGRARIVTSLQNASLSEGDILVTEYTDPSWTPLFVTIGGLITEVGGLSTHGAIIAREYGLPAVVSVKNATNLIQDGQQIRLHGSEGYVEIL